MNRLICALLIAVFAAAALAEGPPEIGRFSTAKPGGPLPSEWKHVPLASFKNNTEYSLVSEDGAVVIQATAHNSASFLATKVDFDAKQFPVLSWRWKVKQSIPTANSAEQSKEDSPARIMIAFDGDMSKLSAKDRFAASAAKSISGLPLPYATLMYIWGQKVSADSLTTSTRSARIKMLAVSADEQGVGKWQSYSRNLVEDFKRAFGEEPGKVLSIEIMTDTDNTGGDAQSYYGDIGVSATKP